MDSPDGKLNSDGVKPQESFTNLGESPLFGQLPCNRPGAKHQIPMAEQVREAKALRPPLPPTGKFTRSTMLEICLGDFETIGGALENT